MQPIVFFGSDQNSTLVLTQLFVAGYPLTVVTDLIPNNPVHLLANQLSLPTINYNELLSNYHQLPPDIVGIVASFGHILPPALIERFPQGILCLHPSLLPQYRGATPVPHAIALGDQTTGITLFKLTAKVDQGEILAQDTEPIHPSDTTPQLLDRLFTKGSELLVNWLTDKQTHRPADLPISRNLIFTRRFTRESGFIEWPIIQRLTSDEPVSPSETKNELLQLSLFQPSTIDRSPSTVLHDLVRALTPWPGIWTNAPTKKGALRVSLVPSSIRFTKCGILIPGKPKAISWSDFTKYYFSP